MPISDTLPDVEAAIARWIERVPGRMGGRAVLKDSRVTVNAVHGRVADGDTVEALLEDYPAIPREAFVAALEYARTRPRDWWATR